MNLFIVLYKILSQMLQSWYCNAAACTKASADFKTWVCLTRLQSFLTFLTSRAQCSIYCFVSWFIWSH